MGRPAAKVSTSCAGAAWGAAPKAAADAPASHQIERVRNQRAPDLPDQAPLHMSHHKHFWKYEWMGLPLSRVGMLRVMPWRLCATPFPVAAALALLVTAMRLARPTGLPSAVSKLENLFSTLKVILDWCCYICRARSGHDEAIAIDAQSQNNGLVMG